MQARRIFSRFKHWILGRGRKPRKIWSGPLRGLKMTLDPANQSQYIMGLHEREVYRWLGPLSQGALSAIDIGAASGEYALYFLTRTKVEQLLTFDPDPVSRQEFIANLALNGFSEEPRLKTSMQYLRSKADADSTTLDDLLPELKLPVAIKMDVDGGEVDILEGAKKLLATGQSRWLIETHAKDLEDECVKRLTAAGLKVTIIPNAWWRIIVPEQRPIPHNRWLIALPS